MSTNFYFKDDENEEDSYAGHIGLRSAAGPYCWDCKITLCTRGTPEVHSGRANWYDACPKCGKEPAKLSIKDEGEAGGIELGFAKPNTIRPIGVRSCSSFTWAQNPYDVINRLAKYDDTYLCVRDEYDRLYTRKEFLSMLEFQCPIRYTEMIGAIFQ